MVKGHIKGKILLVEDDDLLAESLMMALSDEGYVVERLWDGIALSRHVQFLKPQLIILDVYLPSQRGDEIASRLKEKLETAHIPIILISAHGDLEERARLSRVENYLQKPFQVDDLLSQIRQYLEKSYAVH